MSMKRPVLIISPIPSHPQDQGNSARIFQMGRMFQLAGHPVHFIYLGLEGLSEKQAQAKRQCWDAFFYIQPSGPAPAPSLPDFYHVDDWYDERISILVQDLCQRWDYTLCLVNYVWCSKALEVVPEGVMKVIDTHDVFGDRHLIAKAAGLEPTWFYTSKELEAMALRRADLIIAIQDEEEAYFRELAGVPVLTLGYVIPAHPLPPTRRSKGGRIRVGYLGSGNPFNIESIRQFQEAIEAHAELSKQYDFHLAGAICMPFSRENRIFKLWGRVDEVGDFYQEMDILLNPMVGGTGLKIKSIEVLAYGRPLLATKDAMVGICAPESEDVFQSPEELVDNMMAAEPRVLNKTVFTIYAGVHQRNFQKLQEHLE